MELNICIWTMLKIQCIDVLECLVLSSLIKATVVEHILCLWYYVRSKIRDTLPDCLQGIVYGLEHRAWKGILENLEPCTILLNFDQFSYKNKRPQFVFKCNL